MIKLKKLTNKILLISADSQPELNETFLRLQEYYESPVWKDKIFTYGQYRQWYAESTGAFTYLTDWTGFNVPSSVFKPFISGLFDPLMPNEKILVDWVRDRSDNFAVIGSQPGSHALEHEICHALYATEEDYKSEVTEVLAKYQDQFGEISKMILDMGYNESVLQDEIHAYISDDINWLKEKKGITIDKVIHDELRAIRAKFKVEV